MKPKSFACIDDGDDGDVMTIDDSKRNYSILMKQTQRDEHFETIVPSLCLLLIANIIWLLDVTVGLKERQCSSIRALWLSFSEWKKIKRFEPVLDVLERNGKEVKEKRNSTIVDPTNLRTDVLV
uniref:Uncharacterized protein n=1 Tax=Glossina brevipalpis TaxID=37001 RepID=A0A1A9WU19_9MUSC